MTIWEIHTNVFFWRTIEWNEGKDSNIKSNLVSKIIITICYDFYLFFHMISKNQEESGERHRLLRAYSFYCYITDLHSVFGEICNPPVPVF